MGGGGAGSDAEGNEAGPPSGTHSGGTYSGAGGKDGMGAGQHSRAAALTLTGEITHRKWQTNFSKVPQAVALCLRLD